MKVCHKCKENKLLTDYPKNNQRPDGLLNICKVCNRQEQAAYKRTKIGVIASIYSTQKRSSVIRKQKQPEYSRFELEKWLLDQPLFHTLFDAWVSAKYTKWLKPSCDRDIEANGYVFSNLVLMTWKENFDKAHVDAKAGRLVYNHKSVMQYDLNNNLLNIFVSIRDAARTTDTCRTHISRCCNDKAKPDKYIWKFKGK